MLIPQLSLLVSAWEPGMFFLFSKSSAFKSQIVPLCPQKSLLTSTRHPDCKLPSSKLPSECVLPGLQRDKPHTCCLEREHVHPSTESLTALPGCVLYFLQAPPIPYHSHLICMQYRAPFGHTVNNC